MKVGVSYLSPTACDDCHGPFVVERIDPVIYVSNCRCGVFIYVDQVKARDGS